MSPDITFESAPTELTCRTCEVLYIRVRVFGFLLLFYRAQAVNAVELASLVEASYRYPRPAVDWELDH